MNTISDIVARPRPLKQRFKRQLLEWIQICIDVVLGTDTTTRVSLEALGIGTSESTYYDPVGWISLHRVMRRIAVSADDVFLDAGCGKGRGMMVAATKPFRRILGVDISDQLVSTARRNIDVFCRRVPSARGRLHAFTHDITTYDVPDDVTFVFMFNPFSGSIMEAFLYRLHLSLIRRPRHLRILYANPKCHEMLLATGWLKQRMLENSKYEGIYNQYETRS